MCVINVSLTFKSVSSTDIRPCCTYCSDLAARRASLCSIIGFGLFLVQCRLYLSRGVAINMNGSVVLSLLNRDGISVRSVSEV